MKFGLRVALPNQERRMQSVEWQNFTTRIEKARLRMLQNDAGYTEWADRLDAEDIEAQEQELQNQQAEQLRSEAEQC